MVLMLPYFAESLSVRRSLVALLKYDFRESRRRGGETRGETAFSRSRWDERHFRNANTGDKRVRYEMPDRGADAGSTASGRSASEKARARLASVLVHLATPAVDDPGPADPASTTGVNAADGQHYKPSARRCRTCVKRHTCAGEAAGGRGDAPTGDIEDQVRRCKREIVPL